MTTPAKVADEVTQLRWRGLPELLIHRFQDQEEVLEVHRCRKLHSLSQQHFWIQSVLNRLDFTDDTRFFAFLVTDAVCRPATVAEVMVTYDSYRHDRHSSVFPSPEIFTGAIVMREDGDEYAALLETREDYYAIHWSNSA